MIYAKILCDSLNVATQDRLTTMEVEYPLYIHNEVMTHRMFSRNSASSRAIPVAKRLQRVLDDPVIPIVWPKNEPGMSASVNLEGFEATDAEDAWLTARIIAVDDARSIAEKHGVHKQIANRIVEPWCWMKTIISATEWENFFALRTAKDAHPDLQELAFHMLEALVLGSPQKLQIGEWHIPYSDKIYRGEGQPDDDWLMTKLKVSVARCARISYLTQDGVIDVAKDIEMHDKRLLPSRHMSPFEHQAQAVLAIGKGNFRGFQQYRHTIPGETRFCVLDKLYEELKSCRVTKSEHGE